MALTGSIVKSSLAVLGTNVNDVQAAAIATEITKQQEFFRLLTSAYANLVELDKWAFVHYPTATTQRAYIQGVIAAFRQQFSTLPPYTPE